VGSLLISTSLAGVGHPANNSTFGDPRLAFFGADGSCCGEDIPVYASKRKRLGRLDR
jgi:hypothetical protein